MRIDDIKGNKVPAADARKVVCGNARLACLEFFCHVVRDHGTCLMMVNVGTSAAEHMYNWETHGAKMKRSFFWEGGVSRSLMTGNICTVSYHKTQDKRHGTSCLK